MALSEVCLNILYKYILFHEFLSDRHHQLIRERDTVSRVSFGLVSSVVWQALAFTLYCLLSLPMTHIFE